MRPGAWTVPRPSAASVGLTSSLPQASTVYASPAPSSKEMPVYLVQEGVLTAQMPKVAPLASPNSRKSTIFANARRAPILLIKPARLVPRGATNATTLTHAPPATRMPTMCWIRALRLVSAMLPVISCPRTTNANAKMVSLKMPTECASSACQDANYAPWPTNAIPATMILDSRAISACALTLPSLWTLPGSARNAQPPPHSA